MTASNSIDIHQATSFLQALGNGSEDFGLRFFRDKGTKSAKLVSVNSIASAIEYCIKYNSDGYGVFVCVNKPDGNGQSKENIVSPRAFFIDCDGNIPNLAGLPPASMVVQSSTEDKKHYYWLLDDDQNLDQYERILHALVIHCGSDKACKDSSRVLRIPGFLHCKNEAILTTLLELNENRYSLAEFEWLLEFLQHSNTAIKRSVRGDNGINSQTPTAVPFKPSQSVLEGIWENIKLPEVPPLSGWNDVLNKTAYNCGIFIALGGNFNGVCESIIASAMKWSAVDTMNINWNIDTITSTVHSGITAGIQHSTKTWLNLVQHRSNLPKNQKRNLIKEYFFSGQLRLNDLTEAISWDGNEYSVDDLARIVTQKYTEYDFQWSDLTRSIYMEAERNRYSPVRDYFDSLTEQPIDILNGKFSCKNIFGDSSEIAQTNWTKWLLSTYRRGRLVSTDKPVPIEGMLIIQSPIQGIGKTEIFRKLMPGQALCTDFIFGNLRDDAATLASSVIAQMSEFESAYTRKDLSEIKEFLTKNDDKMRVLYKSTTTTKTRHCTFAGSTNQTEFLRDDTNRRFWVIACDKTQSNPIPLDLIKDNRDELWGAVKSLDKTGVSHTLSAPEQELLYRHQKQFLESDPREHSISRFLSHHKKGNFFNIEHVYKFLEIRTENVSNRDKSSIKRTLIKLGCMETRINNVRGYYPPAAPENVSALMV